MSDQIDPTVDKQETIQVQPESSKDPASQDPQDQSPKDLRKTISENYQKKLKEVEAEALLAKQRAEELQAKLDSKNKSDEELAEEAKRKQEALQNQIDSIKRTSEVEKALIDQGISPELRDLITEKAVNLYKDDTDLTQVITTIQTQYPSAFKVQEVKPKPIGNIGITATSSNTGALTREEVERIIYSPDGVVTKEVKELGKSYGIL